MNRKLIVILLFIMSCIFSISCKIMCENIVEDKKILVVGNIIGISGNSEERDEDNELVYTTVKNIGIMTGIDLDTNRFTAFGHQIPLESELKNSKCYEANCFSIDKSIDGKIGKLNASSKVTEEIGNVTENKNKGVFGKITDILNYNNSNSRELYLASRYEIKKGKAKLYINLNGRFLEEFDIEIDSVDYLSKTKNIHIKVIDNKLLEKTGGIVKGMSGTPIVQNGKLIGAINSTPQTNVTEAYGIFADKLF